MFAALGHFGCATLAIERCWKAQYLSNQNVPSCHF